MHTGFLEQNCPELTVARAAAAQAGAILMESFGKVIEVREKAASDLVSSADVASEASILAAIRAAYPQHMIMAEESQAAGIAGEVPEHLWIIDPLDGTTNFLHGLPHFAVSIAYYRGGEPVCGVVFNPARDDWYLAVRGEGAFRNGERLSVGKQASLSESLIGLGFYYDRGRMMEATLATIHALFQRQIHGVRRFGTASLDLAHVASGHYGAYFEYQLSPWDFAAGRLLVEEAGGTVTTARGEPLPFEKSHLLASNKRLHDVLLEVIDQTAGHLWRS